MNIEPGYEIVRLRLDVPSCAELVNLEPQGVRSVGVEPGYAIFVVLAVTSALLGVFLYGLPLGRTAVGPNPIWHVIRSSLRCGGSFLERVVWLAGQAVFDEHFLEMGGLAIDLAGVPVMLAVGTTRQAGSRVADP